MKECPEEYANRFDAKLDTYIHQKPFENDSNDQRWAIFLVQNANLTPDTTNSLTFQLNTGGAMRKEPIWTSTVPIQDKVLKTLIEDTKTANETTYHTTRTLAQDDNK